MVMTVVALTLMNFVGLMGLYTLINIGADFLGSTVAAVGVMAFLNSALIAAVMPK